MKRIILFLNFFTLFLIVNAQSPKFSWAKGLNGTFIGTGTSIAIDASGNIYTTGSYYDKVDFDPGLDSFIIESKNGFDIFVSKLDAAGNFVWAKSMGGLETQFGTSIALDASGNVYTTGQFVETVDFDPGAGVFNLKATASGSTSDAFISKLDVNGNFVWAKKIGGGSIDQGNGIKIDLLGNIYVIGNFYGTVDFDLGAGVFNLTAQDETSPDIFILKLNASGDFIWARNMGGLDKDYGNSFSIDKSGYIYSTGSFNGKADFDPGSNTNDLTSYGKEDIFISKLDAAGNFVWAKNIGGTGKDLGNSIVVDSSGNVYITGQFAGTVDFNPGSGVSNLTSLGLSDIFILKLDASGNFLWAKSSGSTSDDNGYSIAVDQLGNSYITGGFMETVDFDSGPGIFNMISAGEDDVFILKLDGTGNFKWAIKFGGTAQDISHFITLNSKGDIFTTGEYSGIVDFDPGAGISNLKKAEITDIFIHKMSQPTGYVKEMDIQHEVSIYPNPTAGILNIKSQNLNNPNIKIQILNSTGQIVIEQTAIQNSQFNIQHFPEGLYLVRIFSGSDILITQKIVKH